MQSIPVGWSCALPSVCIHSQNTSTYVHTLYLSLVFRILDKLNHNIFVRLDLQHLQYQAEEGGGHDIATVHSSNVVQRHGLVHQQFTYRAQPNRDKQVCTQLTRVTKH